jgi:hypothetical protein
MGDAIDAFRNSVRLRPDCVNVRFNFGAALAMREIAGRARPLLRKLFG